MMLMPWVAIRGEITDCFALGSRAMKRKTGKPLDCALNPGKTAITIDEVFSV